jgi:quercetin dioxygenase-like cupin family protein
MKKTEPLSIDKTIAFSIADIIEYIPHSVVIKTLVKKATGSITAFSFDSGEALTKKIIPFDTFVQVIDGRADIIIDGVTFLVETGQSIAIPAHTSHIVKSTERFKMISTIIKSGYE